MIALMGQWRLLLAAGAGAAVLGLLALWRLEAGHAQRLQAQLAAAQALARSAQAQAAAAGDAAAVVAAGAARDQHTLTIHTENSHVLQAAPGSATSLDPGLNAAGRRGLCGYAAYDGDPACVQLRGDGAGQRSPAGAADAPAGR
jgi:hypothetical protein